MKRKPIKLIICLIALSIILKVINNKSENINIKRNYIAEFSYTTQTTAMATPPTTPTTTSTTTTTIITTATTTIITTEITLPPMVEVDEYETNTEIATTEMSDLENQLQNAIIIHNQTIQLFCGEAEEKNIDKYDVVQDNKLISDYSSIFFFGHSTGSFSCLKKIEVGEIIELINDGIPTNYIVTRSEKAEVTNNGHEIQSCFDGTKFIYNDFEYENIRLFTCFDEDVNYRWVVIAQKITEE